MQCAVSDPSSTPEYEQLVSCRGGADPAVEHELLLDDVAQLPSQRVDLGDALDAVRLRVQELRTVHEPAHLGPLEIAPPDVDREDAAADEVRGLPARHEDASVELEL